MSADATERDLQARVEALRRELAGLTTRLSKAAQRLVDLEDELRSRRHAANVVTLDRRRRGKGGHYGDILADFVE
jgi:cell division septum initiation protein DivIVA